MEDLFPVGTSGDDLPKCLGALPQAIKNEIERWKRLHDDRSGRYLFEILQYQIIQEMQPVLSTIQGQPAMRTTYRVVTIVVVKDRVRWGSYK